MLSERAMQLDAEEDASGRPSIWRDVYNLMRCPGPPCNLKTYCWRDNIGKKHYKLKTHHLKRLIRHIKEGGLLESHDAFQMRFANSCIVKSSRIWNTSGSVELLPWRVIHPSTSLTSCLVKPQPVTQPRSLQKQSRRGLLCISKSQDLATSLSRDIATGNVRKSPIRLLRWSTKRPVT